MPTLDDFAPLRAEVEEELGTPLDALANDPIPVLARPPQLSETRPLWAVKVGERAAVSAKAQWVEPLQGVVDRLGHEELFAVFGAYEMARVTLPDGVGLWGPSWYYVGDQHTFQPPDDNRPVQLTPEQLAATVDFDVFWHCQAKPLVGFGVFEDDQLAALAIVTPTFESTWEIGVDAAPQARGRGLGLAVVGAAGRWILQNDRLVLATTAPWNIPSARTLRSVGLSHVLSDMIALTGPFTVPPQPLGFPYPGAEVYNHYPNWAMNQHILPRQ